MKQTPLKALALVMTATVSSCALCAEDEIVAKHWDLLPVLAAEDAVPKPCRGVLRAEVFDADGKYDIITA